MFLIIFTVSIIIIFFILNYIFIIRNIKENITEWTPVIIKNPFIKKSVEIIKKFNVIIPKNADCKSCNELLKYLKNMSYIDFLGNKYLCPSVDYLEYLYGKDWNIPKKEKFTN